MYVSNVNGILQDRQCEHLACGTGNVNGKYECPTGQALHYFDLNGISIIVELHVWCKLRRVLREYYEYAT